MPTRCKLLIRLNDHKEGTREIEGFAVRGAPGLVITPEQCTIGGWTITHEDSGLSLPIRFHQAVDALRFAILCGKHANWDERFPEKHGGKEAFVIAYHEMRRQVPMYFEGHTYGRRHDAWLTPYRWYTTTTNTIK
mgnify:CR=1 FL=1